VLTLENGITQPQVFPPGRLIQILQISQDSFQHDLEVPVVLSEAYAYVLYDIVSIDVYLVANNLVHSSGAIGNAFCVQCVQNNTISLASERYGREIYPYINVEANKQFCDGCALGKAHRQSFGTRTSQPSIIGEQINADVCGPMTERSAGGAHYYAASNMIIRNFVMCS
jgi:hypothetical protein